jgi:hypothetical protein
VKKDILNYTWLLEEDKLLSKSYAIFAIQPFDNIEGGIYSYEKRV